jgi:3-deoxy-D-manno-octulosonate 8-phosphate phosphatase (KDO 8-P phosphatase)
LVAAGFSLRKANLRKKKRSLKAAATKDLLDKVYRNRFLRIITAAKTVSKDLDLDLPPYPEEVWARARPVRLLILDIDGVLTDGSLYFDAKGETLKVFHVRDGHGIKMAQRGGLEVALVSGRRSDAAFHRARELDINRFYEGVRDKVAILEELLAALNLTPREVAAVGDELVDLPLFHRVGLGVAVADAVPELKAAAHWVTSLPGGKGAVREVCDLLLKARGVWEELLRPWQPPDAD